MPRVVEDQRHKFYNDELFRKLSRESEVSQIAIAINLALMIRPIITNPYY